MIKLTWIAIIAVVLSIIGGVIRTELYADDDTYSQMDWEWDCEWDNECDPDYEEAFDDYDNDYDGFEEYEYGY